MENKIIEVPIENLIFCFPSYNIENSEYLKRANNSDGYIELRKNIKKNGIVNPLLVEDLKDGKYKVRIGNMRLAAMQILGYKTLPCIAVLDISPSALKQKRDKIYKNIDSYIINK